MRMARRIIGGGFAILFLLAWTQSGDAPSFLGMNLVSYGLLMLVGMSLWAAGFFRS